MLVRNFNPLLVFLSFILFSNSASAQSDIRALLERVNADIAARYQASLDVRFSYNMDILVSGSKASEVALAYEPSFSRAEQWKIISPTLKENEDVFNQAKKRIDRDAEKSPDAKDDRDLVLEKLPLTDEAAVVFISEENGISRFGIEVAELFLSSDEDEDGLGMENLSKYLSAEMAINTNSDQLLWLRMYSKKPFKPVAVAKIKEFDIYLRFAPAWEGGPIVQIGTKSDISGSALFRKFSEKSEIVYSNFKRK